MSPNLSISIIGVSVLNEKEVSTLTLYSQATNIDRLSTWPYQRFSKIPAEISQLGKYIKFCDYQCLSYSSLLENRKSLRPNIPRIEHHIGVLVIILGNLLFPLNVCKHIKIIRGF